MIPNNCVNYMFLYTCLMNYVIILAHANCSSKNTSPKLCKNGGWSHWGQWTMCSKTCNLQNNSAIRYRSRACIKPRPQNGGAGCSGPKSQIESCSHLALCDIDGGFTNWVPTTPCKPITKDKKCSPGRQEAERYCTNPKPNGNGKPCRGRPLKFQPCWFEVGCDKTFQPPWNFHYYRNKNSLELIWQRTPWGNPPTAFEITYWLKESPKQRTALTIIANEPHPYGESYSHTIKHLINKKTYEFQITSFNSHNHASVNSSIRIGPLDGRWGIWGFWSECSQQCVYGIRTRIRSCSNPAPLDGGHYCRGQKKESIPCFDRC